MLLVFCFTGAGVVTLGAEEHAGVTQELQEGFPNHRLSLTPVLSLILCVRPENLNSYQASR